MPGGFISMNFDVAGAKTVKLKHANIDLDTTWKLQMSTDGGSTWTDVTSDITSTPTLTEQTINVNYSGKIRFKVSAAGASNTVIYIDDFSILN
jgi:hypothetical protein